MVRDLKAIRAVKCRAHVGAPWLEAKQHINLVYAAYAMISFRHHRGAVLFVSRTVMVYAMVA